MELVDPEVQLFDSGDGGEEQHQESAYATGRYVLEGKQTVLKDANSKNVDKNSDDNGEEAFYPGEEIPHSDKDSDCSCDASVDAGRRDDSAADQYEESKKEG